MDLSALSLLLFLNANGENPSVFKVVNTNDGLVRGKLDTTLLNRKQYYSFRGIPFAKPPIGEFRFRPTELIDSRRLEVFDAFEYGKGCIQSSTDNPNTSEDCLFINIFVPVVKSESSLPVLFHIFGGMFFEGTGDDLHSGPDFLMEKGIILVTFNHRLGILGFMSLGTPEYSGNMELKDQQLALKWTYENIANFGGDNTRITMSGHSSGAMCIGFHMLNDESAKYIQQVFMMSGTSNLELIDGDHRRIMEAFAERQLNVSIDSLDDLIDFLNNLSEKEILSLQTVMLSISAIYYDILWIPLIEKENALQPFIPGDIVTTLGNSCCLNITSYYTFTNREAMFLNTNAYYNDEKMDEFLSNFSVHLPLRNYISTTIQTPYMRSVMNDLRDFYFANATTAFDRMDQRIILDSDMMFLYYIEKFMTTHVDNSYANIFYHRFSIDTKLNTNKRANGVTHPGAIHVDDLCYLFRCRIHTNLYKQVFWTAHFDSDSAIALETINNLSELVSNFVQYGEPSISGVDINFMPVQANITYFLDLTNDGLFMGTSPNNDRMGFLEYIIEETEELINAHGDTPLPVVDLFYNDYIQLN